jgi:3',5'-cyclic AMP phosphodiesterase CpdA
MGADVRSFSAFQLFDSFFGDFPRDLETPDVLIVGLNTSVGWQPGFDWSLGRIVPKRLEQAAAFLAAHRGDRLGVVACHHPLHRHPGDMKRSRTFGGEYAFDALRAAGMDIVLHGHLHRPACRSFPAPPLADAWEISANTALADRERGGPAGYNIIDVEQRRWQLTVMTWRNGQYDAVALKPPN